MNKLFKTIGSVLVTTGLIAGGTYLIKKYNNKKEIDHDQKIDEIYRDIKNIIYDIYDNKDIKFLGKVMNSIDSDNCVNLYMYYVKDEKDITVSEKTDLVILKIMNKLDEINSSGEYKCELTRNLFPDSRGNFHFAYTIQVEMDPIITVI